MLNLKQLKLLSVMPTVQSRVKNEAEPKDVVRLLRGFHEKLETKQFLSCSQDDVVHNYQGFMEALLEITPRPTEALLKRSAKDAFERIKIEDANTWGRQVSAAFQFCRQKAKSMTSGLKLPAHVMRICKALKKVDKQVPPIPRSWTPDGQLPLKTQSRSPRSLASSLRSSQNLPKLVATQQREDMQQSSCKRALFQDEQKQEQRSQAGSIWAKYGLSPPKRKKNAACDDVVLLDSSQEVVSSPEPGHGGSSSSKPTAADQVCCFFSNKKYGFVLELRLF